MTWASRLSLCLMPDQGMASGYSTQILGGSNLVTCDDTSVDASHRLSSLEHAQYARAATVNVLLSDE